MVAGVSFADRACETLARLRKGPVRLAENIQVSYEEEERKIIIAFEFLFNTITIRRLKDERSGDRTRHTRGTNARQAHLPCCTASQRREAWCVWAGGFGGGHKLYEKGWARCFFLLHNAPQPPANTRSSTRLGGANE